MPVPAPSVPQTYTDRARGNLANFVETTVRQTLAQSRDYTADFPGFIASPNPAPGPFGVAKAIAQQSCRRWARGEGIPSLPGFDAGYGGICGPYLDSIGEQPVPGSIGPPFRGGQCYGVNYNFTFTFTNNQGQRESLAQQSTGRIVGTYSNPTGFPGEFRVGFRRQQVEGGPIDEVQQATVFPSSGGNPTISGVSPVGGGNDVCGNPPTTYKPPESQPNLPALPPITVDLPGIGPVDVDVTFGPDGEIVISLPDLGVETTIGNPFTPDGGGQPGQNPPGFQGNPGDAVDVGPGGAAEGEDPDRALLGVLVQTISYPPRVNRLFNPTESYTKGAYYVYLGGDAGLALIDTAAITRPDQFYPAPPGSNRFRVVPNTGFTIRVTPFYGEE